MNVLDRAERMLRWTKAAGLVLWALLAWHGHGIDAARAAEPATDNKPETPSVPAAAPSAGEMTVEQVAERCRPSIVVITFDGRDGKRQGLGSGFIVSPDGLIARTCTSSAKGVRFPCNWPTVGRSCPPWCMRTIAPSIWRC